MAAFSKEDKILIKSLYQCKGYNARQFITDSFRIKVGRRTASTGSWWSWESSKQRDAWFSSLAV